MKSLTRGSMVNLEHYYHDYLILDFSEHDWVDEPKILVFAPRSEADAVPLVRVNTIEEATDYIDRVLAQAGFNKKFDELIGETS